MSEDRLKKAPQAALDQESGGGNPVYNGQDVEEAEDAGYMEVEGGGKLTLTQQGWIKLANFN